MIKVITKIYKPFGDLEETEEEFMNGILANIGILKSSPNRGRLWKTSQIKRDELDRLYFETIHIFTDISIAEKYIEKPQPQARIEKLRQAGYEYKVKYIEIDKKHEHLYMEKIADEIQGCPDCLNGCQCSICEWTRSLKIPNKHKHNDSPTKLEHIGKTGYEK